MKRYQVTVEEIVDKPESIPLQPAEAAEVTSNGPHVLVRREYLQEWMDRAHDAEKERDSALGSQKAAVEELEVERQVSIGLREKLRVVRNWFDNDVNNLRGRDSELLRAINASVTGKESGQ